MSVQSRAEQAPRSAAVAWAYFLGVMTAYALVILMASRPPALVDYPDWVFQGVLLHSVLTGHPIAGYMLKPYPVPNSLTTVALGLLDCVLPWALAAKLWICAYLVLASAATWRLSKVTGTRDWRLLVALPSVLFLNLDLWWGHISFEIGLCLFLLFAAVLLQRRRTTALSALLLLLFFTHMEACACALLLLTLAAYQRRNWTILWATAPTLLLTLWYTLGRYTSKSASVHSAAATPYRYGSFAFLLYKFNTFLKPFGYVNAHSENGWSLTEAIFGSKVILLLVAAAFLVAGLCFSLVLRRTRGNSTPNEVLFRRFAVSAFVTAAVLPQIMLGVADPGSRLILAGVGLGLFGTRWRRSAGTALALCSLLFCGVNLWQFEHITRNPQIPGKPSTLPRTVETFAHVEPRTRLYLYEALSRGQMDEAMFQTGIFQTALTKDGRP